MVAGEKFFQNLQLLVIVLLLSLKVAFRNSSEVKAGGIRCLDTEREALLKFKDELIDEYGLLSSWGTTEDKKDCCQWRGVRCQNETNNVVELDLHGSLDGPMLLRGNISPWLIELQHLNYLDLSYNNFNLSRIPTFIGSLGRLQGLDLSHSNFSGPIPYHLGNLSELQYLAVRTDNGLITSKNLDWLSRFQSLRSLDLSSVNLTEATNWLESITKLSSLDVLYLASCWLPAIHPPLPHMINASMSLSMVNLDGNELSSSSVFSWMFTFSSSLSDIDLSHNNLRGPIPDAIGDIISLASLHLSGNQLEGGIPVSFGNLSSLRELYLSDNHLSGILSEKIGSLSKLEVLYLSSNDFDDEITEAHFFNLSQLHVLDLSSNPHLSFNFNSGWNPPFQLTDLLVGGCKLGPHFPAWLRTQKGLEGFDISNNEIDDSLPSWFWDICPTLIGLNLSHNNIRGVLPDLSSKFSYFNYIDLSFNDFNGPLPILPPNGFILDLSSNKLSGSINGYCNITYWNFLDLSNNLLSGQLPDCFANQSNLYFLSLAHNNFHGNIPSLNITYSVHLQNNSFTGVIPKSWRDCTSLRFIDLSKNMLSGRIPTWVGDSLPKLVLLSLRSNEFFGTIPPSLCRLAHIQVMDFSLNNISGAIPKCLNNLTAMIQEPDSNSDPFYVPIISLPLESATIIWKGKEAEYMRTLNLVKVIDLSSNNLEGEIPYEIMSIVRLVGLNLSRNNLSGSIPPNVGQLQSLNFLDLSRNHLSGEIPVGLSQLDGLGVLDLSYNKLSGRIPWMNHLQTFDASAYVGNSGLCGPPLTKTCPSNKFPQDQEDHQRISEGYYNSIVLGFIFGFLGMCGVLLLNKSFWIL